MAQHLLCVKIGNKDQNTDRKSLCHKYLRQILRRKFAVTPYAVRVYVEFFVHYCTFVPPSNIGNLRLHIHHYPLRYTLPHLP
jgi:hypothetical protein